MKRLFLILIQLFTIYLFTIYQNNAQAANDPPAGHNVNVVIAVVDKNTNYAIPYAQVSISDNINPPVILTADGDGYVTYTMYTATFYTIHANGTFDGNMEYGELWGFAPVEGAWYYVDCSPGP